MRTIEEIRRDNLVTLVQEFGSQRALADVIDKKPAQISQWITMAPSSETGTPRAMSSEVAREIESIVGRERGWMDHDHSVTTSGRALRPDQLALLKQWDEMPDGARKSLSGLLASTRQPRAPRKSA